jgi:hypothetical protein
MIPTSRPDFELVINVSDGKKRHSLRNHKPLVRLPDCAQSKICNGKAHPENT